MTTITQEETKADELINGLKKGKSIYEHFSKSFREGYMIAGDTIANWEKKFKLSVQTDLDPSQCKVLDIELMNLHQEASFFLALARACQQSLKTGSQSEYLNRYTALVAEYKAKDMKLPSATTLENLANEQLTDVHGALMAANIACDFWSDIIEHLAFCRKLVENMVIASSVQAKLGGLNNVT